MQLGGIIDAPDAQGLARLESRLSMVEAPPKGGVAPLP